MTTILLPIPPSTKDVIAAYEATGSVWKAGKQLGISGQRVSVLLKAAGHATNKRWLTDAERLRIRLYYEGTSAEEFDLDVLANAMGRTKHVICYAARKLGLTRNDRRPTPTTREAMRAGSKGRWTRRPHPRGMLGKKHTPETLERVAAASQRNWNTWKAFGIGQAAPEVLAANAERMRALRHTLSPERIYSRAKSGRREDIGDIFLRSSWEANYARYLNLLLRLGAIVSWEYEPETFWFDGIRRGVASYKPDFRIIHKDDPRPEYIEIKGWVTAKDRTKWKRMAKYHPTVNLTIIGEKQYRSLAKKWASAIPNWESDRRKGLRVTIESLAARGVMARAA